MSEEEERAPEFKVGDLVRLKPSELGWITYHPMGFERAQALGLTDNLYKAFRVNHIHLGSPQGPVINRMVFAHRLELDTPAECVKDDNA